MNLFITGTDTHVGKTFICARLLCELSDQKPFYYKPIQTGAILKQGQIFSEDILTVNHLTGSSFEVGTSCSYLFRAPLSPFQAAKREHRTIRISKIQARLSELSRQYASVVMEGAGGLYVPITRRYMMLDLIEILAVPVILVVRPGLGTINHSLLSLNALKQRKIPVLGFIVNNFPSVADSIAHENAQMIQQFSRIKCLGIYSENRHSAHFLP